jgi:4-amino-4-deoxy-L-arabinose transferase-like glycosyltransferase
VPVNLSQLDVPHRSRAGQNLTRFGAEIRDQLIRQSRWLVLAFATLAAIATWIATRHGPSMSPDSVTYLSAARNLASGHGYTDFTGQALTNFPPGYPSLIAATRVVGASVATGARIVNAVSFGAIVLLAWVLVRRHVTSMPIALGTTALVAISPALINIASNAWSEPLYCALALAFIVALEHAIVVKEHQVRSIAAAAVLAGLAFLVRYVGLSLLVVGSLVLIASSYRDGMRAASRRLAQFWIVGLVIPALWILRNAGSGTRFILGPRVASPESWGSFIGRFVDGVASLFTPNGIPLTGALVAVVVGLGGLGFSVARYRRTDPKPRTPSRVLALVIYVSVYVVVVVSAGKTAGASVNQRIVTPLYVPVLILGAVLLEVTLRRLASVGEGRWVAIAPGFVVLVVLTYLGSTAASFASQTWSNGEAARGYTQENSEGFQLVPVVEALPPRAMIATNRPWTLFEATGRQPIVPSPGKVAPELSLIPISVSELASQSCKRPVYLAWFVDGAQWPYTPAQLARHHLGLRSVQTLSDGAVLYSIRPPDPECSGLVASKRRGIVDRDAD